MENGCMESFHDKLRYECLNHEVIGSFAEARFVIEQWRREVNWCRSHGSLGCCILSNSAAAYALRCVLHREKAAQHQQPEDNRTAIVICPRSGSTPPDDNQSSDRRSSSMATKGKRSLGEWMWINRIRVGRRGAKQMSAEIEVSKFRLLAQVSSKAFSRRFVIHVKLMVRGVIVLYLLSLLLVTIGLHWWGQSNITSAALMYLPPWIWIAPTFVMMVPALILDWRPGLCLSLATVLFSAFHLDIRVLNKSAPDFNGNFETLKVLTWNRGQGNTASLKPIKDGLQPDFILLQETSDRGYPRDSEYAEFMHISGIGEFVLLSRWPILKARQLHSPGSREILAVRYVVAFGGRRCVIYNVYLPSPRETLESYKRGAFISGILGFPGSPWVAKKTHYQAFWDEQLAMARDVADHIAKDKDPVIVVGDFNTPAFGPIYRIFASQFQDAHLKAGEGTGFTFPGNTHNPLALFRPWLRLDMIFAPRHWKLWSCETIETQSRHRPVFAELEWADPES
ncbi:MAG: integrase core domain-containing protein [Prosthecobacter sp.]